MYKPKRKVNASTKGKRKLKVPLALECGSFTGIVYVYYGWKASDVVKYLESVNATDKLKGNFKDDGIKQCSGLTIPTSDLGSSIVWTHRKDMATLVHELAHATFNVMKDLDVPISFENQETFCYLLDNFIKQMK